MQDSSKTKKNKIGFLVREKVDTRLGCYVGPSNINSSDLIESTETFGGKIGRERQERLGGCTVRRVSSIRPLGRQDFQVQSGQKSLATGRDQKIVGVSRP
jgi:hypothetical protein